MKSSSRKIHPSSVVWIALILILAGIAAMTLHSQPDQPDSPTWSEVDEKISEQQFEAASKLVDQIAERARERGDEADYTRALVRRTLLRTALHGYATAVRELADAPWPETPRYLTVTELIYAQTLLTYQNAYSWEIRQRERVISDDEVDLERWTLDQIWAAAQRAHLAAFERRASWGEASLGDLAEYFVPGNYPSHVRGTLRDAVTHLWVESLADSSMWRPEHSNEIFRLDRDTLIDAGPEAFAELDLAAPETHPLLKIAALLTDLEAWHLAGERPEAAFEARRERYQRLRGHLDQDDDREAIRASLERRLEELGRTRPWWAMGMADLAELTRQDDAPDSLIEARRIALGGAETHPESRGGKRCRQIVAAIEQPAYEAAAMLLDGPGRRSIQVRHKNLEALYFRAFAIDFPARLADAAPRASHLLPDHRETEKIVAAQKPVAEWSVELPPTPDYRLHQTYSTPPLGEPGLYLIAASARRDFREGLNQRLAFSFFLGDLVLLQDDQQKAELTVRSGREGRPLEDIEVELYRYDWRQGHQRIAAERTDDAGRVSFATQSGQRYFAFAHRGAELALLENLYSHHPPRRPVQENRALVYTDRAVYRPGQEVLFKVVAYRAVGTGEDGGAGSFEILPEARLRVAFNDANGQEVDARELATNAYGSASGAFPIPAGRLLGGWSLAVSDVKGGHLGGATVRIEEYKRPTFEVEIHDPEEPLRLNRQATLTGEARYYFGLPATGGEVAWTVTREPVWPRWYFHGAFDRGFRGGFGGLIFPGPATETQIIAHGETDLDAEGRFTVTFTPEADERLAGQKGMSYRYRLSAEVTDPGGETRSASRAFRLGFVAVEADFTEPPGFLRAATDHEISVTRRDLDGQGRAGVGRWRLLTLDQPGQTSLPADLPILTGSPGEEPEENPYATPGDGQRPRWDVQYQDAAVLASWGDGEEVSAGEVNHAADGSGQIPLPPLPPGAYRLRYATEDPFGQSFESALELIVEGASLALSAWLRAAEDSVSVGETARLFLGSGLADQVLDLEIVRGPGRFRELDRRRLGAGGPGQVIELPIGPDDRGGVAVRLTLLRDHQWVTLEERIDVPWDDRRLRLDFTTFRDRVRPGAEETWTITVRDGQDENAPALADGTAELLAYMYDRSLDLFALHSPPDPLSVYPHRVHLPSVRASLGQAPRSWYDARNFVRLPPAPAPLTATRLKTFDGYGIGGPGMRGGALLRSRKALPMAAAPQAEMVMAETSFDAAGGMALEDEAVDVAAESAPPPADGPPPAAADEDPLRSDFAETAFWEPHLLLGEDGTVSFEFTVPDSLTEWSVWAHALTRDLRAGRVEKKVKSVKELMVRPYLPRFLRAGDSAELRVVVQNAGGEPLEGALDFEILDPVTEESLLDSFGLSSSNARGVEFSVEPGGSSELVFEVTAPRRLGAVHFRVMARAGDFADGELRPLPVLPSRFNLAQSRFAALREGDERTLTFEDLRRDDPTRVDQQIVVTLDGQLFYSVLEALPYLVEYPYNCVEQLLNRFLSTGIVSTLYDDYPAVAAMAKEFAARETPLEAWDEPDPNRAMTLIETPWLIESRGGRAPEGPDGPHPLINVLDPEIARAQRDTALAKIREAQTASGGFPWWPGGPPSPFMTLYLVDGFSRALEFGVEMPDEVRLMVARAWNYLHEEYFDERAREWLEKDCCAESITYLAYVLSNYPDESWTGGVFTDDDRRLMLEHSLKHWRKHSPRLKCYLALVLSRAGREEEAVKIFASVMDSAKTTQDEGTFWAPEERSWLWYNDTVETHAFTLRTLVELDQADERRHGLVQWLFLDKHLNHWKSTRATAEALYGLLHYLDAEGALGQRESATVALGSRRQTFVFEPESYSGKDSRVIVSGEEIEPAMAEIEVSKEGPGFLFASATWHFSTEELPEEARGDFFSVERRVYKRSQQGGEWVLEPLEEGAAIAVGDQLEVELTLRAKHQAEYVHLRDPRPAGCEPETLRSGYRWALGIGVYEEIRDSGANFFFEILPVGEYVFRHRLRANVAGTFRMAPAVVQSMYAPEFVGYSSGDEVMIAGE